MMSNARNGPLCNVWTTQAQISLRICAGWSGPSFSAYRISGYCSIQRLTENPQIRLHRCTSWFGPILSANCIRALFMYYAVIKKNEKEKKKSHNMRKGLINKEVWPVFIVRLKNSWLSKMRPVKILIKLRECSNLTIIEISYFLIYSFTLKAPCKICCWLFLFSEKIRVMFNVNCLPSRQFTWNANTYLF